MLRKAISYSVRSSKSALESSLTGKAADNLASVYYLHSPSYTYPLEKILEGVNEVYNKGYFKYFGLSNYKPEDVQRVYDLSKAKGWVLPTYYQGNYNAAARGQEEQLFPTLRKLGIVSTLSDIILALLI